MASENSFERGDVKPVYESGHASMHSVAHKNVSINGKVRDTEYEIFNWRTESVRAVFYDPDTDKILVELRPDVAALAHEEASYTVGAFEEAPRDLEAFEDTTRRIGEKMGCRLDDVWHVGSAYPGPATLGTRVQFCVGRISIEEAPLSLDRFHVLSADEAKKLLDSNERPVNGSAHWLLSWVNLHRDELREKWPPKPRNPEAEPQAESKPDKRWPSFRGRIHERERKFESRRHSVEKVRVAYNIGKEFGIASHEILDWKSESAFVLLYDPKLNKVALVEEFKPAPDAFGESPFVLSTVAGNVEKGESPLAAAQREASEETGMSVPENALRSLGTLYADRQVGTKSHLFAAIVDLSAKEDGSTHGLTGQNEITRRRIYTVEEAQALMKERSAHLVSDALFLRFLEKKPEIDRELLARPASSRQGSTPTP